MSNHYYQATPQVDSHEQRHNVHVANLTLQLYTDNGVFSKAGLDFGSRVLIETLAQMELLTGDLLDVGCGYGPIGISLAKLFSKLSVTMVDINERAVELARKNMTANDITNGQVLVSNLYEQLNEKQFDSIISNPPIRAGKAVVHAIIEQAYSHLRPEGTLTIVIQKKQGAPSAEKKMEAIFGNVTLLNRQKGYWILSSQKPK